MKLWATIVKEGLLLARDPPGLVLMLLLPMAMAVIVTLVQEDAFDAVSDDREPVLLLDRDGGELGGELAEAMEATGQLEVLRSLDGVAPSVEQARDAVAGGDVQVCLLVPEGATAAANARSEQLAQRLLPEPLIVLVPARPGMPQPAPSQAEEPTQEEASDAEDAEALPPAELQVWFDPASRPLYRRSMLNALHRVGQAVELELIFAALEREARRAREEAGQDALVEEEEEEEAAAEEESEPAWQPGDLVSLQEAGSGAQETLPSSVQQNVPAWTLFAMFMIVIPLSGTIILERDQGTLTRLRTLPVSPAVLLGGKLLVYLAVCSLQFGIMLAIGRWLLPLLGTERLELGDNPGALLLAALCGGLAATGLGVMLGSLARTRIQAAVVGSSFAIIAGVLGGVMVPVFLMPAPMQPIAAWSPLNWGLTAFLDVFLRDATLAQIAPQLGRLLAFFAATLGVALVWGGRRE